jgi:hypothetical protein
MKAKKSAKKMDLSKRTVANLDETELISVRGGLPPDPVSDSCPDSEGTPISGSQCPGCLTVY